MNFTNKLLNRFVFRGTQKTKQLTIGNNNKDLTTQLISKDIVESKKELISLLQKSNINQGSGVADLYKGLDLDVRLIQAEIMVADDTFYPNLSSHHLINGSFYDCLDEDVYARLQIIKSLIRCDYRIYPIITDREIFNMNGKLFLSVTFGKQTHEFFALKPCPVVSEGVNHLIFLGTTEKRTNKFYSHARISIVPFLLL